MSRFKLLSGTYETGKIDNAYQFLQWHHDPRNNPTRMLDFDTGNGSIKPRVYCQSNGETKADGSSRTIKSGLKAKSFQPPAIDLLQSTNLSPSASAR